MDPLTAVPIFGNHWALQRRASGIRGPKEKQTMTTAHTLDRIRAMPEVAHVDDERDAGNGIIVTLRDGYEFAADPGCGVRGFDTVAETRRGCARAALAAAKGA
jgi:hypothetical protein